MVLARALVVKAAPVLWIVRHFLPLSAGVEISAPGPPYLLSYHHLGLPQPHAAHINARQRNRENPGGRPELRQGQGQAARAEESGMRTVGGECPSQQLLARTAQLTTHNAQDVNKMEIRHAICHGWLAAVFISSGCFDCFCCFSSI